MRAPFPWFLVREAAIILWLVLNAGVLFFLLRCLGVCVLNPDVSFAWAVRTGVEDVCGLARRYRKALGMAAGAAFLGCWYVFMMWAHGGLGI